MVLRNFPEQPSFVVEWDYPVMVEREDLDPEDVAVEEVDDEDDHGLLDLIKGRPHTSLEWQVKAAGLGLSRATFYRIKRKLTDNGHIGFDFTTKTWSLVKVDGGKTHETPETGETIETCETAPGGRTDTLGTTNT